MAMAEIARDRGKCANIVTARKIDDTEAGRFSKVLSRWLDKASNLGLNMGTRMKMKTGTGKRAGDDLGTIARRVHEVGITRHKRAS
jgi:hypothetical protein